MQYEEHDSNEVRRLPVTYLTAAVEFPLSPISCSVLVGNDDDKPVLNDGFFHNQ
ncbi:unnamed protein product [Anisakis simplex]|uniref:Flavin reductase n=1 Tax=Anisakis simplex TaxID=6269 RepID=A0A0M3KHN8_ANISI|nr:unnamed protein product [Anisakis simplex]